MSLKVMANEFGNTSSSVLVDLEPVQEILEKEICANYFYSRNTNIVQMHCTKQYVKYDIS